ncbi:MAG: hypothetical protein HZA11_12320 [Nitrospirae bacterium]|nr:hypothetical protein [Nitrospirota bacterium]
MTKTRFHKSEIARRQLETAVRLFLSGMDQSSVITLAGASSGILDRLVRNAGKEPFVDYACRVHRELIGHTPKRRSYSHHIDKRLGIIAHKHLSKDDDETVELDLEQMACDALTRALADYMTLYGKDEPFVKAFFNWAWETKDGQALMKEFETVSDRLRPA